MWGATATNQSLVHPRMRGERTPTAERVDCGYGSSPHARGTQDHKERDGQVYRFIPACAGNAFSVRLTASMAAVHPRMRGERPLLHSPVVRLSGSSPHARGTQSRSFSLARGHRFIPACAGNAPRRVPLARLETVHPRMRGERVTVGTVITDVTGSSPHARGTRQSEARQCSIRTVHPRMRGERDPIPRAISRVVGSSPHARGTRQATRRTHKLSRFIPACAGNAIRALDRIYPRTVHPRMRGERFETRSARPPICGSSPHARGTRKRRQHFRQNQRFIPACAGNAPAGL